MSHFKLIYLFIAVMALSVCGYGQKLPSGQFPDSSLHKIFTDTFKDQLLSRAKTFKDRIGHLAKKTFSDSVSKTTRIVFPKTALPSFKSGIQFNGGFLVYNFNYRKNIDTPIVEKNILQHSSYGQMNFSVFSLPVNVSYLVRRSNSEYYRDINDVQVAYDAGAFQNNFKSNIKQRLIDAGKKLHDSILELDYQFRLTDFAAKRTEIQQPAFRQKFIESKEILSLPDPDPTTDSAAASMIKTLKAAAETFLAQYESRKNAFDSARAQKDRIEERYRIMKSKELKYQQFIDGVAGKTMRTNNIKDSLKAYGLNAPGILSKYGFLSNINKLALGRNQVNYSELTSKNTSLTGINFEYNSWYYIAFAAGTVDYRFRDFVVDRSQMPKQHMYLVRLGIGKMNGNHFILTAYKGQKQLFAAGNGNTGLKNISLTGYSAEAKMNILKAVYVTGEIAQSLSPDFRLNPAEVQKFTFNDRSNKAYAFTLNGYFPQTKTNVVASYKYTGANFQSFSSFQSNSETRSWLVKYDQQFLKRKLKLTASLRTNDFSNPYIPQTYRSNSSFKSVQLSFKSRNLPFLSIGYIPITQLTYVNELLTENRFNSLNAVITHVYKLFHSKASTTLTYNRFYNTEPDTAFAYYNARNLYFNHSMNFDHLLMSWSVSQSISPSYTLRVLNPYVQFRVGRYVAFGFGAKINNFNDEEIKAGPYGNFQVTIRKLGTFNFSYDKGYIPGGNRVFLPNDIMNFNFIKRFSGMDIQHQRSVQP